MTKRPRQQLFVNSEVQRKLIVRTVLYWTACVMFVLIPATLLRTWNNPESNVFRHLADLCIEHLAILACAATLLPLFVYDMLRLSNRIAGPMFRLLREMEHLANGNDTEGLQFRPEDFWTEAATEFNRIAERLRAQNHSSNDPAAFVPNHNDAPQAVSVPVEVSHGSDAREL